MRRRDIFFKDDGKDDIKKRLNAWIEKQKLTDKEQIKMLEAVLNQRKNIYLVRETANKAGFELTRFINNKALDLYFDILNKDKNAGYISKGWDDPGFRVGEYFEMDKTDPAFKEKFYKVHQVCSGNLISVGVSEKSQGKVGISLEIGIYAGGLTEKVLKSAVETIESTMCKIKGLI